MFAFNFGFPQGLRYGGLGYSVGSPAMVIPFGSTMVGLGDSLMSQKSNAKSIDNPLALLLFDLKGHLRPLPASDQGIGGNTTAQMLGRVANTAKQRADVVFFMAGTNDIAGSVPVATIQSNYDAILSAIWIEDPTAIVVCHPLTPNLSESPTIKTALNGYLAAKQNLVGINRLLAVDVPPTWNPAIHTNDGAGPHYNALGAQVIKEAVKAKLAPYLGAADNLLLDTGAVGYHGANLHARTALAGATGTMSGTGILVGSGTGVATGCTVVSTVAGLTITATKGTRNGFASQVLVIQGTVTTAGTVTFSEGTSTISATPGQMFENAVGAFVTHSSGSGAPVGLNNLYNTFNNSFFHFTTGRSATDNLPVALDGVLRPWTVAQRVATGTVATSTVLGFKLGDTVDVRIELWSPIMHQTELTVYAPPYYPFDSGIKTATDSLRFTGTLASGVGTLVIEYGSISGGAPVFGAKRIYKGGSAAVGTGTLLGTVAAGITSWTATGVTAGDVLYVELDVTNTAGAYTARSTLGYTAA